MNGVVWFIETRQKGAKKWRRHDDHCETEAIANANMKEDMAWDATHYYDGRTPSDYRVAKYARIEEAS